VGSFYRIKETIRDLHIAGRILIRVFCVDIYLRMVAVVRGGGVQTAPPPEIPKALQNRAKLNPTVKTVKIAEFRKPTHQDVQKEKAVKF